MCRGWESIGPIFIDLYSNPHAKNPPVEDDSNLQALAEFTQIFDLESDKKVDIKCKANSTILCNR